MPPISRRSSPTPLIGVSLTPSERRRHSNAERNPASREHCVDFVLGERPNTGSQNQQHSTSHIELSATGLEHLSTTDRLTLDSHQYNIPQAVPPRRCNESSWLPWVGLCATFYKDGDEERDRHRQLVKTPNRNKLLRWRFSCFVFIHASILVLNLIHTASCNNSSSTE